ncbi:MAG: DUF1775 domain-containing protein, partial [Candidatus Saccharimonadales bacterium]
MITKLKNWSLAFTSIALLAPAIVSAHVVVNPSQIGIGAEQTFTISVPNEKQSNVTRLKLLIPAGLSDLSPTVKPGWQIQADTTGSGDSAVVTAVTWSGGTIPVGQRDDFSFSAQAPAKA